MTEPALRMEGISKRFPGVVALDGVNLEVYPAEIVALIGENGAGKSTLMKILGGVVKRDSGTVSVSGSNVQIESARRASELGIEFIHQELSVLDNLDVAANIFLRREPTRFGWLRIIDRKRIYPEADIILSRLGLDISSHTPLSKLSLAQQQLVEIARAISVGARILIMDEPTSSLTLTETRSLLEIIKDLKSQGVSVIYISHRLDEVKEIADRVVALRDGKNAGTLAREEITHERMVRLMVGRDLKDFYISPEDRAEESRGRDPNWFTVRELRTTKYPQHAVSFSVGEGEILGLAGLVGAGRSEVARAIFGVDPAPGSEITLGGQRLRITSPRDAIATGLYLVPEDRRRSGLILETSVKENITLPGLWNYAASGLINSTLELEEATAICRANSIKTPSVEVRAATLSGGNQQKIVLSKWLALGPKVLIFDEPTRGIDVGAKAEIYALMRQLAARGVAMIAISSDMEEVLGISDRIAVMREGRITGIVDRATSSEEVVMRLATGGVAA
ncbi:MAG: sugar ABC transporter ATP-binding protein [Acidobacteriota bacterium]